MSLLRRHRPFATWLSLLALVLATLAPGIAAALALAQTDLAPWPQICSTSQPQGGTSGQSPAGSAAPLLDHCPFCSLHSDGLGLPAAVVPLAHAPAQRHALPSGVRQAPRTLQARAFAQPRAPPLPG